MLINLRKRVITVSVLIALVLIVVLLFVVKDDKRTEGLLPKHENVELACNESERLAASAGLPLQPGWKLLCPANAEEWNGTHHEGITCAYVDCPEGVGPYIAVNPSRAINQSHLNAVVLHESVHMMKYVGKIPGSTYNECEVDLEAERRGANPAYLNYCTKS